MPTSEYRNVLPVSRHSTQYVTFPTPIISDIGTVMYFTLLQGITNDVLEYVILRMLYLLPVRRNETSGIPHNDNV